MPRSPCLFRVSLGFLGFRFLGPGLGEAALAPAEFPDPGVRTGEEARDDIAADGMVSGDARLYGVVALDRTLGRAHPELGLSHVGIYGWSCLALHTWWPCPR